MAEILSYNPYRDMHNDVQFSAMFFGKNFQNIPLFNSTQTIEAKRLCYSFDCFTFTGKERDSETGFSYFGARYYDSDLMTGWLSVDPMADKYPGVSPYAYCAWNPVRLVDPDGRENLSALKWARENLSNKGIPFGPGFNDAKGWNYSRGSIPNELYCYDACFVAYMNSDENIVKFLMNTGFSTPNGTFFGRCKYPGGIDWFKNGNGKDRTFETDISKGELGDIIFMGDCVSMNGHTALLNAPPQFGTYINEDGTTIETVTLHTLSTQSDSDPDNFGEKEYTFAKQRNGTWKLDGGTNLVFRGYGQIKSIPNENQ